MATALPSSSTSRLLRSSLKISGMKRKHDDGDDCESAAAAPPTKTRRKTGRAPPAENKDALLDPPKTIGEWTLGAKIGEGGFARLFDAYREGESTEEEAESVIKIAEAPADRLAKSNRLRVMHADSVLSEFHTYKTFPIYTPLDEPARFFPNIRITRPGYVGGWNFLVMEKIKGETLSEIAKRREGIDDAKWLCRVGARLLRALQIVHRSKYIHGDVKPSNIMIRNTTPGAHDEIVLLDFGVATFWKSGAPRRLRGTLEFMAARIHKKSSPSRFDDLESLAYTLIWMVEGKLPWSGMKAMEVSELKDKFVPPANVPARLAAFLKAVKAPLDPNAAPSYEELERILIIGEDLK